MLDLFGELGGVLEIVILILGSFLLPISRHSFYIEAIRTLFFARTKEGDLMFEKKNEDQPERLEKFQDKAHCGHAHASPHVKREIQKHYIIRLKLMDNIKLYLANNMPK